MFFHVINVLFCIPPIWCTDISPASSWEMKGSCTRLSQMVLEDILGPAYNPRYMSIEKPSQDDDSTEGKRDAVSTSDFYVSSAHRDLFDEEPAWRVNHAHLSLLSKKPTATHRTKREVNYMQQWHCPSRVQWTDLGKEYFPRHIRSVHCMSESCWFGLYKCTPRSFTIKVLRRKKGLCAEESMDENLQRRGVMGLPKELKELWIWEERALTFCCDCAKI